MPLTIDIKQILKALPFVTSVREIAVDVKVGPYTRVAHISDISLSECKCRLLIRCSKPDQYGNSVSLIFTHSSDNNMCPVLAVKLYLSVRPNIDGPLFCHFSRKPLTKYQLALHFVELELTLKAILLESVQQH
ncbi:hypothetical protein MAR_018423 [Mya arenaria]|uniref:Uncharacterized protein n=1 Tax=Mya arenaria TaxID=6604 RepID=A0ABY7EEL2_MYAAR|nr:hypothetical protein MAR_018423 [Mya arenaria]